MQVSKKIPFEDPQVLLGVRVLYVVSNLIILGIYFYMQMKINTKKGRSHPHCAACIVPADLFIARSYHPQIRRTTSNGLSRRAQTHHYDRPLV